MIKDPVRLRFFFDYYLACTPGSLPLWFPDGVAKESDFNLTSDTKKLCNRLSTLFDQKINQNDPVDQSWSMPKEAREEFNRMLPILEQRIRAEIPLDFEIEFCQELL